jgi:antitoxin ParD1/3/4
MRATMNVSLPAPLKSWVEEQVSRRGFGTASEFIRQVLREEQLREAKLRIDAALIEGIESGPATPMTAKDWAALRREGRKLVAKRRRAK